MSPRWPTPQVRRWDRDLRETADQPRWWTKQRPAASNPPLAGPRPSHWDTPAPPLAPASERLGVLLEAEGRLQEGAARRPRVHGHCCRGWTGLSTCRGRPSRRWAGHRGKARGVEPEPALSGVLGRRPGQDGPRSWQVVDPEVGLQSRAPLPQGTGPAGCWQPARGPSRRWRGHGPALGTSVRHRPPRAWGLRWRRGGGQCRPRLIQFLMVHFCPEHLCMTSRSPKLASLDSSTSRHRPVSRLTMGPLFRGGRRGQHLGPSRGHPGSEGYSPMWLLTAA